MSDLTIANFVKVDKLWLKAKLRSDV